ncbi:Tex-like N-terminal domain-containing protein [Desulfamplus magnetovallimortis]|uniref:Tex-like N-terminal domain-containing protein n=1 Tax=Desulfamplus magnetovallimortis TaxID=1246637 RepID=UPI0009BC7157|nr:Tex-like N-terminal domain-containing protein [Desulfamplus magnetovallimortis]
MPEIKPSATLNNTETSSSENHTAMLDIISRDTGFNLKQIRAVSDLLDQGATIPFMARYRKEVTGSLDEVAITLIRDSISRLKELADRKNSILKSLEERELLTDELKKAVVEAATTAELEDIYQKYRPKKRTRAMIAREKGLEPLAEMIIASARQNLESNPEKVAARFITSDKVDSEKENLNVKSVEDALSGARDIVAEIINEDTAIRSAVRHLFKKEALISSVVKKKRGGERNKIQGLL